jgi:hypothetical protein
MNYTLNPFKAADAFWHGFMCTSHGSDSVEDDWSMYCMGGEL